MNLVAMSASDLLQRNSLCGVPQCMAPVGLESVLRTDGENRKQELWGEFGRCQSRNVEEREVLVEAADVAFQKSCQGVP